MCIIRRRQSQSVAEENSNAESRDAWAGGPGPVARAEVAERLSISQRTLWRLIKHGRFPPPIRYGRRLVRWRRSDLNAWLETAKAML